MEKESTKLSSRKQLQKNRLHIIEELTKEIAHNYFAGNLDKWFDMLHKDCIWAGSGEPTLMGADNIREYFRNYEHMPNAIIINESYLPLCLSSTSFIVNGHLTLGPDIDTPMVICQISLAYRMSGNNAKIMYQHMSYDFIGQMHTMGSQESSKTLPLDINSRLFIRQMLLTNPQITPIAVNVGTQTYFIDPNTIIYLQSDGHRTNLHCIDKVINCSMLITDIAPMLTDDFYLVRRGCMVNSIYVTAIRRCEIELVFGTVINIPVPKYTKVKKDLQEMILHR